MTTKTTKTTTGPANTSRAVVEQNPRRYRLTIRHVDAANADVIPLYAVNADADADSAPLGSYGSSWTFEDPTARVEFFCATPNVKLVVEEQSA